MSLLRKALLWASTNPFLAQKLPRRRFVQRAARRFMPGEAPEDALGAAERLREDGFPTLLTLLGENVDDVSAARQVVDHYVSLLDRVTERGLDAEISVKPTQLGLDLGLPIAIENLTEIVEAASRADRGIVWIDMESSPYVDPTLDLFRTLRERHENVGLCLQAYLRRTESDLEQLLPLRPAIRIVKGAYMEADNVAFPDKKDVDRNFVALSRTLLEAVANDRADRPGIATHDPLMHREATAIAVELGVPSTAWEFEMLYGIGVAEQGLLRRDGLTVRILISYGEHWFPWYMRRLAERPANVGFVIRKMLGL